MRKHQQRQILEILQTLHEAQAAGMFADCQEAAIAAGEFIEEIAGEGTQTVALLEEYCEMLFQASNNETGEKQLRKQLISIENSVKNELKPDKIEIAFLPYNLSMWDSLESIYFAAREDKNCDAYVVPLPYYDFDDETKTLGEKMHYDGDKYPENIPVTHWQTYDIEERRPDIIFIHYAYDDDGNNFSVPPEFYSRNLRQHCELLIYVPYYVSREEWIPQFFADLPGVLNSHHVIVQSEAVRQVYVDHFNKSAKEYGFGEQYGKAKDKFLALGSPKFDKVINTNSEDCPLPEKWERLITKPDGEKKKIVLYNTHMFTWINNAEQYFKKIRSVFSIFKNRDDIVLWWRPHPGTELNFQKHKPEMLGDYYAVVKEYQEGNVGIYDDTPDLHRAIAWSDAYYGDSTSVEVLYATTGKLVMRQNIMEDCDMPPEWERLIIKPDGTKKKIVLYYTHVRTWIYHEQRYFKKIRSVFDTFKGRDDIVLWWRPHPETELTFQKHKPEMLGDYHALVEEYKSGGWGIYDDTSDLHRAVAWSDAYYGDKNSSLMVLFEAVGKAVMVQNVNVTVTANDDTPVHLEFENLYDDGENFWFTSLRHNALFKMDKQAWEAEYVGSFPNEDVYGKRLYGQITEHNNKLYFAPFTANEIGAYDVAKNQFEKIAIAPPRCIRESAYSIYKFHSAISYKNSIFFVCGFYPAIIRLDTTSGHLDYFSDWVDEIEKRRSIDGLYFYNVVVTGNRIIAPAANANAVMVFDMDTCISKVFEVGRDDYCYIGACFDGEAYWLIPYHQRSIIKWNIDANEYEEYADFPEEYIDGVNRWRNAVFSDGYIWLFPSMANLALKINVEDRSISIAEEFQSVCVQDKAGTVNFKLVKLFDSSVFAYTSHLEQFITYDFKSGEMRKEPILFSRKSAMRFKLANNSHPFSDENCDMRVVESRQFDILEFIDYIADSAVLKNPQGLLRNYQQGTNLGTSGNAIYTTFKKAVFGEVGL